MSDPTIKRLSNDAVHYASNICGHLFEKGCCNKAIQELDLSDSKCLVMFSTKLIGYAIIVGASAVKIPQVLKIFKAKSGAGITVVGVILELLAITFNSCYSIRNNFPFSAWGEAIFLAIETALIAFLVLWYDGHKGKAISIMTIYSAIVYCLLNVVSKDIMWWCQSTVLYLAVSGKLFQAVKNYKAQHTGQISAITAWAILAGSVMRIFTTIQETGDKLTAVTFAAGALANALIAFQVVYYWTLTQKFLEKGRKKKDN